MKKISEYIRSLLNKLLNKDSEVDLPDIEEQEMSTEPDEDDKFSSMSVEEQNEKLNEYLYGMFETALIYGVDKEVPVEVVKDSMQYMNNRIKFIEKDEQHHIDATSYFMIAAYNRMVRARYTMIDN